jgi:hypothetical protein
MITSAWRRVSRGWINEAGALAGRGRTERAGMRLHGAGCLRSRGCLRSLPWERFQGGGAGNRTPRPARGQMAPPGRGRAVARAAADPVPAGGPDLGSRVPRSRRVALPSLLGQEAARPALTARRSSLVRATPDLATADRTRACPRAAPAAPGTARRTRETSTRAASSTRRRSTALTLAARRRDSSTATTRSASTRSSSRRARRVQARAQGFTETRDPGPFPGLTAAVSPGRALAVFLDRGTAPASFRASRRPLALPGPGRLPPDRPATRRPASFPARRGKGRGFPEVLTRAGRRRPARTAPVSNCRPARRHPATTRRARPTLARRPLASTLRPARTLRPACTPRPASSPRRASSLRGSRSLGRGQARSSPPAGPGRACPGRERRGPVGRFPRGRAGRGQAATGPPAVRRGTRGQGRDASSMTIPTGC